MGLFNASLVCLNNFHYYIKLRPGASVLVKKLGLLWTFEVEDNLLHFVKLMYNNGLSSINQRIVE